MNRITVVLIPGYKWKFGRIYKCFKKHVLKIHMIVELLLTLVLFIYHNTTDTKYGSYLSDIEGAARKPPRILYTVHSDASGKELSRIDV